MAKGNDIEERLKAFAVQVLDVCDRLPRTPKGRHIILTDKRIVDPEIVAPLKEECIALSKIIAVSRRTAAVNAGRLERR